MENEYKAVLNFVIQQVAATFSFLSVQNPSPLTVASFNFYLDLHCKKYTYRHVQDLFNKKYSKL